MSFLAAPAPRWFTIAAAPAVPGGPGAGPDRGAGAARARGAGRSRCCSRPGAPARALAEAFLAVAGGRRGAAAADPRAGRPRRGRAAVRAGRAGARPAAGDLARRAGASSWRGWWPTHEDALGRSLDAAGALELADALAGFLDSVADRGGRAAGAVDGLAPGELARHWQVSAEFLKLALAAWPARLDALGLMDVGDAARGAAARAGRALGARRRRPGVVVAAGSTGSDAGGRRPADRDRRAPQGAVVLPGLDLEPRRERLGARSASSTRRAALKRLLTRAGVDRGAVARLAAGDARRARPLAPAADQRGAAPGRGHRRLADADQATCATKAGPTGVDPIAEGLDGLSVVYARAEEEAAAVAALLLREALETPGRTAALVTPDAGAGPPGQRAADPLGRRGRLLGRRAAGRLPDRRADRRWSRARRSIRSIR